MHAKLYIIATLKFKDIKGHTLLVNKVLYVGQRF